MEGAEQSPQQPQNTKKEKKGGGGLKIVVIIQLLIILGMGYFIYDMNEQIKGLSETVSVQDTEIQDKKAEIEGYISDLVAVRAEREALGLANDSLDAQIEKMTSYVSDLERKNNLNVAQIRNLNKIVADLKTEVEEQQAEIVKLKEENAELTENVDSLTTENTALVDSVVELSTEKESLQSDLDYAKILHAYDVEVTGLKESGKEFKKQPYPGKKLSTIDVTFTLADNKAANKDNKEFQIRMVTPSGKAFSDPKNGGGSFEDADGNTIEYTMKKNLTFDNSGQFLTLRMLKGFNYKQGNYIIQVYCEGFQIGQGSFIVK